VSQSLARAQRARNRLKDAEEGVQNAVETADKNLQGLGQIKRIGEQVVLIFRPQEAVAAVAALDQAYRDYYAAVADGNRAQFALYPELRPPAAVLSGSVISSAPVQPKPSKPEAPVAPTQIKPVSASMTA